jgi:hypothetical protein
MVEFLQLKYLHIKLPCCSLLAEDLSLTFVITVTVYDILQATYRTGVECYALPIEV